MVHANRPQAHRAKMELALSRLCMSPDDARLEAVIEQHIQRALWAAGGEISLTADLLGMHRRTLQRTLDRQRRKRPRRRRRARP